MPRPRTCDFASYPTRVQPPRGASGVNGITSGISEVTLIDPEEEKKKKQLAKLDATVLKCLACAQEVKDLTEDVLVRCGHLHCIHQLLHGQEFLDNAALKQIKEEWRSTKYEDLVRLLRRLVKCKQNYQQRTASNAGTDAPLIECHNALADALVRYLDGSWMIYRILTTGRQSAVLESVFDDYPTSVILSSIVDLHILTKFVPCATKRIILSLLLRWYTNHAALIHTQIYNDVLSEVVKLFATSEDYVEQLQIAVLLGFIYQKSVKFLHAVAYKSGLRMLLQDFVNIFHNCKPVDSPIPDFAYEAVNFTNERRGIHRRVYSFLLNTPCYAFSDMDTSGPVPIHNPFVSTNGSADHWYLSLSAGSRTLSFELESSTGRFFVWIPFEDVVQVEVSLEHSTIVLRTCFVKHLSTYYDGNLANTINDIGSCDTIGFRLGGALAYLALLEKALQSAFGHRCGTDSFHGEWNVPETVSNPFRKTKKSPAGNVTEAVDSRIEENEMFPAWRSTIDSQKFEDDPEPVQSKPSKRSQASKSKDIIEVSSDDKSPSKRLRAASPEIGTPEVTVVSQNKSVILDDSEKQTAAHYDPCANDSIIAKAIMGDDTPIQIIQADETTLTAAEVCKMVQESPDEYVGQHITIGGHRVTMTPVLTGGEDAPVMLSPVHHHVATTIQANGQRLPLEQISNGAHAIGNGKTRRNARKGSSHPSTSQEIVTVEID